MQSDRSAARGHRRAAGCRSRCTTPGVQEDVVMRLLAGEHVTQHDPVVVPVRLVTEHRDRELRRPAARSISSTTRAPAMPLPITTSRRRLSYPALASSGRRMSVVISAPPAQDRQRGDRSARAARPAAAQRPIRLRCPPPPAAARERRSWLRWGNTASAHRRASAQR